MAIDSTTFEDLTPEQRKIAFAVYNKMASKSIDFKSRVMSEDDNVLMVKADGSEAGYRTMRQLKESVEDYVVEDYNAMYQRLNEFTARAYERTIGDGRKSYTITHGLDSGAIIVQLWGVYNQKLPEYEVSKISDNTIQLDFNSPILDDSVQVVIQSNKFTKNQITVSTVDWGDIQNIPYMSYEQMMEILEGVTNG